MEKSSEFFEEVAEGHPRALLLLSYIFDQEGGYDTIQKLYQRGPKGKALWELYKYSFEEHFESFYRYLTSC